MTTLPVPFALNQSTTPLRLGPGDAAEWTAWTLRWLGTAAPGRALAREDVHAHWRSVVAAGTLPRGRISVATAADALRRDLDPPLTGHDNPRTTSTTPPRSSWSPSASSPLTPPRRPRWPAWDARSPTTATAWPPPELWPRRSPGWSAATTSRRRGRRLPLDCRRDGLLATTVSRALALIESTRDRG